VGSIPTRSAKIVIDFIPQLRYKIQMEAWQSLAYCVGLENRRFRNVPVGSNPTASSTPQYPAPLRTETKVTGTRMQVRILSAAPLLL
jgi:hypothetical protein